MPNCGCRGRGTSLVGGMTFSIEPMITAGGTDVAVLGDDCSIVTADGSLSPQFEHTVAVTIDGPRILTAAGRRNAAAEPVEAGRVVAGESARGRT